MALSHAKLSVPTGNIKIPLVSNAFSAAPTASLAISQAPIVSPVASLPPAGSTFS